MSIWGTFNTQTNIQTTTNGSPECQQEKGTASWEVTSLSPSTYIWKQRYCSFPLVFMCGMNTCSIWEFRGLRKPREYQGSNAAQDVLCWNEPKRTQEIENQEQLPTLSLYEPVNSGGSQKPEGQNAISWCKNLIFQQGNHFVVCQTMFQVPYLHCLI